MQNVYTVMFCGFTYFKKAFDFHRPWIASWRSDLPDKAMSVIFPMRKEWQLKFPDCKPIRPKSCFNCLHMNRLVKGRPFLCANRGPDWVPLNFMKHFKALLKALCSISYVAGVVPCLYDCNVMQTALCWKTISSINMAWLKELE